MIQRVVDLKTEPVIGQRYLVPCVSMSFCGAPDEGMAWIPVIGSRHEDREIIGFKQFHWHYDFRFVSDRVFRASGGTPPITSIDMKGVLVGADTGSVEKVRMCRRKMPAYPLDAHFRVALETAFADAEVVVVEGCRLCPHQGLPLDGLPVDSAGAVTCPGHGLCWSKDGRMARSIAGIPA
jgi:hypothetical protein